MVETFANIQQTVINPSHRGIQTSVALNEGESLSGKIAQLLQSNPPAGSQNEQMKQYLQREVPSGKVVKVMVIFATQSIDDAR